MIRLWPVLLFYKYALCVLPGQQLLQACAQQRCVPGDDQADSSLEDLAAEWANKYSEAESAAKLLLTMLLNQCKEKTFDVSIETCCTMAAPASMLYTGAPRQCVYFNSSTHLK